jgi:uncharacterized protein (TIGR02246 family)
MLPDNILYRRTFMSNDSSPKLAMQPEECSRMLIAALESGDIETSVAVYESDAILFKKSGESMSGLEAIRASNAGLIAMKPTFMIEFIKSTVSADGTLATNRMKADLAWTDKEGNAKQGNVDTLEVLRRQPDGSWRYVIDDPYGSMRAGMQKR